MANVSLDDSDEPEAELRELAELADWELVLCEDGDELVELSELRELALLDDRLLGELLELLREDRDDCEADRLELLVEMDDADDWLENENGDSLELDELLDELLELSELADSLDVDSGELLDELSSSSPSWTLITDGS